MLPKARRRRGIADEAGSVEAGSVEAGKRAGLVVLDADPTTDIAHARRVRFVMRNGTLYPRAELMPRR